MGSNLGSMGQHGALVAGGSQGCWVVGGDRGTRAFEVNGRLETCDPEKPILNLIVHSLTFFTLNQFAVKFSILLKLIRHHFHK